MAGPDEYRPVLEIQVVCGHGRPGGSRLLVSVLSWQDDDPELARALRADNPEFAELLLLNDRFAWYETRERHGKVKHFPNPEVLYMPPTEHDPLPAPGRPIPSDESAIWQAGALSAFRFVCPKCRFDRPLRQDRLDGWIRRRHAAEGAPRRVFVLDIRDLVLD